MQVLATGATFGAPSSPPTDRTDMIAYYKNIRARIEKSKDIVIIGGGISGAELASEIKDKHGASKTVTIVHSSNLPGSGIFPENLRRQLDKIMQNLNVITIYNAYGDDSEDGQVNVTYKIGDKKSKTIPADYVIKCNLVHNNSSFIPQEWLNKDGQVKISDTFEVINTSNVFAIGDINDFDEWKLASQVQSARPISAANVLSAVKGEKAEMHYATKLIGIGITMGKRYATGSIRLPIFGDRVLPGFIIRKLKGDDIRALKFAKILGY